MRDGFHVLCLPLSTFTLANPNAPNHPPTQPPSQPVCRAMRMDYPGLLLDVSRLNLETGQPEDPPRDHWVRERGRVCVCVCLRLSAGV